MLDFVYLIWSWLIDVDSSSSSLFAIAFSVNTWSVVVRKHSVLTSRMNKQLAKDMAREINEIFLDTLDERERHGANKEDIKRARAEVAKLSQLVAKLGDSNTRNFKSSVPTNVIQQVLVFGMVASVCCLACPFLSRRIIAIFLLLLVPVSILLIHLIAHRMAAKVKREMTSCKAVIGTILEADKNEDKSTTESIRDVLAPLLGEND